LQKEPKLRLSAKKALQNKMFQEIAKDHNKLRNEYTEKYFKFKKPVPQRMNLLKRGFLCFIAIRMLNSEK